MFHVYEDFWENKTSLIILHHTSPFVFLSQERAYIVYTVHNTHHIVVMSTHLFYL